VKSAPTAKIMSERRRRVAEKHKEAILRFVARRVKQEQVPWVRYKDIRQYGMNRLKLTKKQLDEVLGVLEAEKRLDDVTIENIKRTWFYFPTRMIELYTQSKGSN